MFELVLFMASMLLLPLVPLILGGALILCACISFADHLHKSAPPA